MNRTSRATPTIGDVMTVAPRTIVASQPITTARRLMKEYAVRHLPVVDEHDQLVGIVSERDVDVAQAALSSAGRLAVEDVMTRKPYVVAPTLLVTQVAKIMAAKKHGAAVVVDRGRILGVFTTVDALAVLTDALQGKLPRVQAAIDVERRPRRPRTRRTGREALT
jgi:acetoin utilization protein AcuB